MGSPADPALGLTEVLQDFLTADAIEDLSGRVRRGEAVTTMTGHHVIKVRTSAQPYYLMALGNERRFLALGLDLPVGLPKVVLADFTEARGILVLEKIEGQPLAEQREGGGLAWSVQRDVLALVAAMQRTAFNQATLPEGSSPPYDRNEKARQHLVALSSLGEEPAGRVVGVLKKVVGRLDPGTPPVLSHGDLHPANVLRSGEQFRFVDWEYAGTRPSSYDPATFVLYANDPRDGVAMLPHVGGPWNVRELYEDALILTARQVKNWLTAGPGGTLARKRAAVWAEAIELLVEVGRFYR